MTLLDSPAAARSRRRTRLDPRVAIGTLLVLVCVAVGARLVNGAAGTVGVLEVTRNLAAGTTVTSGDLGVVQVRLGAAARAYVPAGGAPVGRVLARPVDAGELLPRAALGAAPPDRRLVSLPVAADHLPPGLATGALVDVWSTPRATGTGSPVPQRVLASVVVQTVDTAGAALAGGQASVVVAVPAAEVAAAVASAESGAVDVVEVPGP